MFFSYALALGDVAWVSWGWFGEGLANFRVFVFGDATVQPWIGVNRTVCYDCTFRKLYVVLLACCSKSVAYFFHCFLGKQSSFTPQLHSVTKRLFRLLLHCPYTTAPG